MKCIDKTFQFWIFIAETDKMEHDHKYNQYAFKEIQFVDSF